MSTWVALAIVLIVAVVTYGMRAVAIVALGEREIPASFERMLRNVGPAVLAALTVNLAAGGPGGPNVELGEVLALVAAGVTAWRSKSVLLTLGVGMATLWIFTLLTSSALI